ncbi:MAG TPA: GNAT family N-acetyltransferase [Bacteroidota bacterium]|nr:GNAT family N-acetyltransferase [Bacteroidota bacterium]
MNQDRIIFRPMTPDDWMRVSAIYRQGIETGNATFQREVPSWDEWDRGHIRTCRIVAENASGVAGWAALSAVSGRCVYAGVAEVSIYVASESTGQKIGCRLLAELIAESEKEGYWMLQAGIFPENIPSVRIHEANGFRKVGYREKIGKMNGVWRDTLLFERRSVSVGIA